MSLGEKSSSEVLGTLQEKGDQYTKLAVIEKKRLADLEDAIEHITVETNKFREMAKKAAIDVMNIHILTPNPAFSRADGADIGRQAQQVTTKVLNVLEVKLNKLLQRKSEILNKNKALKGEIDHYRRMRLQTDISHAKFEETLADVKEKIECILTQSANVVEERERLVREKESLERSNAEEQRAFVDEYEALGQFIKEQNLALEDALLKERKQDNAERKKISESISDLEAKDLSLEEEVAMAKEVGYLTSSMLTEQNSLSNIQERINSYELMFQQLKKMTSTNSLEEVVSNYVAHEEEMFSLYNFIQTVNAEIDTVVETTHQIELDIKIFKEEQEHQDNQRRSVLDELQHRLENTRETTRMCEEQNKQFQDCVAQVSKKVSSLFFKLQCDQMETRGAQSTAPAGKSGAGGKAAGGGARPESKIALLMSQGVSEGNVLEYMGCIEQRAVDIISSYLRAQSNDPLAAYTSGTSAAASQSMLPRSPTPGPSTPMHWPADPVVDINEFSDEDLFDGGAGDADADSKPIDLSSFKDKLQKKLGLTGGSGGGNTSAPSLTIPMSPFRGPHK